MRSDPTSEDNFVMGDAFISFAIRRCRACDHPVAAPVGLFERSVFRMSRCPSCHCVNPHPLEIEEWQHTRKTLCWGSAVLLAAISAVSLMPERLIVPYL